MCSIGRAFVFERRGRCGCSLAGRALRSGRRGRRFEPLTPTRILQGTGCPPGVGARFAFAFCIQGATQDDDLFHFAACSPFTALGESAMIPAQFTSREMVSTAADTLVDAPQSRSPESRGCSCMPASSTPRPPRNWSAAPRKALELRRPVIGAGGGAVRPGAHAFGGAFAALLDLSAVDVQRLPKGRDRQQARRAVPGAGARPARQPAPSSAARTRPTRKLPSIVRDPALARVGDRRA